MARLIKKEASKPIKIIQDMVGKWICMCGLSKNQPFCDGFHKNCQDERGKTYIYNEDGTREEVE